MPDNDPKHLSHILVKNTASTEAYTPRGFGPKLKIPRRNKQNHARSLLRQLQGVQNANIILEGERAELGFERKAGLILQFESSPDFDLKFESLDLRSQGIQLLSVKKTEGRTFAVCYVPDGKLNQFVKRIKQYQTEKTPKGVPRHRELVASIEAIRIAAVDALWTDDLGQLPGEDEAAWWEIWIRTEDDVTLGELRRAAETAEFALSEERLSFPERTVVTAQCTKRQLSKSIRLVNSIAELRKAKETAAEFIDLPPREQYALTDDILQRVSVVADISSAACILDTGVTQAHPLLSVALRPNDCHAYEEVWGVDDHAGHGTEMAGLALYGNLVDVLTNSDPVEIEHCMESVKILPPVGATHPHLYGEVTIRCVQIAEQAAPTRSRVIGMAVTAESLEQGQPSTWSAAVDSLTSGSADDRRRLLLVSAGNAPPQHWHEHPAGCQAASVQDPGQAWNALTVGAYTELVDLPAGQFPNWHVVAAKGDVSPYSSTSSRWARPWPIKPEVVLEGGNCAIDPSDDIAYAQDALSLLTTHSRLAERPFSMLMMTSAATALATRNAAILQARYPDLLPETIRGLLVHSAEWTDTMKRHFQPLDTREQKEKLLRYCGYGVPDFDRACWSASNELTLIAQDSLQPYDKVKNEYKTKEINFHTLPWPAEVLRDLQETIVELRVTLSYFIEPNPARRGWKGRYRYASHALRFDVKTPTETDAAFKRRINIAARAEEDSNEEYEGDAGQWELGPQLRHLGSVHSDRWIGTAVDLANRNMVAIYPVIGWWRERPHLGRWNKRAQYTLIVSIRTPREEIDIYTPVHAQIEVAAPIEINI